TREARGMDVEPVRPVEQRGWNERPVGDYDDRVHSSQVERLVQTLLLAHRYAKALGCLLRRRRAEPPPATARTVRPGEQELDVVPGGEAFEDVCAQRRRCRDGQPH